MGYSLSWAAVRGGRPDTVQKALALRSTGAREEFPESEITGAELPEGWYLVASQRDSLRLTEDEALSHLSQLGEVVVCFVEEHVMCSFAAGWQGGQRIWSVYHDSASGKGSKGLEVKGQPPASFAAIRDKLLSEQAAAGGEKAGVDCLFDIPVELARSVTGFRHDQDTTGLSDDAFEVLVTTSVASQPKSWWRRLLGF
jgi:hypothetical protein